MNTSNQSLNVLDLIDVNSLDFYNNVQAETESDKARVKKSLEIIQDLRMKAAEMEVKTAALYHAELWHGVEELKMLAENTMDPQN